MDEATDGLDEIDRIILRFLAQDPRTPYADIAHKLEEEGHDMSPEGIRYRVSNLFETTSILLLASPKGHGWEVARIFISVNNDKDAKAETYARLCELDLWMVCQTFGTFDLYGVATVRSNKAADRLVSTIRGLEHVEQIDYAIETERETDVSKYLSF